MDEWHLFTNDILNAGKLTAQEDYAAWSTGIATGTVTTAFLLIFGPVVGYYAGKQVHKKVVVSKVKERLLQDGDMRSVLRRWNEQNFAEKGFQAWLELPVEGNYAPEETSQETLTKKQKTIERREKRRFKIVIIPNNERRMDSWTSLRAQKSEPALSVVPFVEAPTTEMKSPVEMETGSPDNITPLVNHQQAIDTEGDVKYEYRPGPPEIRPDCDTRVVEEAGDGPPSPAADVADGRTPASEVIPPDEKKDPRFAYPTDAFEMDGCQAVATK
jgi:hypothetical protein